jgi:hypothetical protein
VAVTFAIVGTDFKISDLLPGMYSLTINVSDYVTATQFVTVWNGRLQTRPDRLIENPPPGVLWPIGSLEPTTAVLR